MELNVGPETSSGCPAARKKRSNVRRRPHPDPKPITNWQHVITSPSSPTNFGGNGMGHAIQSSTLASPDCIEFDENPQDRLKKPSLESDGLANVKKPKKVKLKLGGVTRTLHANPSSGFSQQNQDVLAKESSSRRAMCQDSPPVSDSYNVKLVHKSSRIPKKRAADDGFDDEDDEEIRYLKKLRASRASGYGDRPAESHRKTKGISKIMDLTDGDRRDYGSYGFGRGGRKSRVYEDNGYDKELASDDEIEDKRKMLTEDLTDPLMGSGPEMTMTTRKRALETLDSGGHVEFPNGLPNAPSKKQKLSEVEQQLRKAEAAQRRRSQAEKAAKEAEAEAIRKILGQDSSRKKKEEKLKKQQEELAQEKTERAAILGPSTVRYVMGPNGTVVSFSEDLGLPKLFDSRPCRYPPPREKCAGPNCMNEYKYRDSKSKLPLCSLHCYKAVQGNTELLPAC